MQKCLELSCLPKPTSGTKSIKFKRNTPGSVPNLIYSNRPPNPNRVLDPTHPALHFKPVQYAKAFPWRSYPGFSLRAVPKSLLEKPSYPAPNPPFAMSPPRSVTLDKGKAREEDISDEGEGEDGERDIREELAARWKEEKGRISMSLVNAASLGIGGHALRVKVVNKLKNAISLVATRGADVEQGPDGAKRIVFRDEQAGPRWVLRDWTYICRTDPRLNLMPYTELIPAVRRALRDVSVPGQRLEAEWGAPTALQVAQLLGSLGPLGGRVEVKKRSYRLDKKKAEVKHLLDELAKQGVTEVEQAVVPPGHVLLERMLKRYKELVAELRAEGVAEAERMGHLRTELAKQGVTEVEQAVVPPGHVLLERMLKRYKELVAELRAEGVAEAERSTLSGKFPPAPTSLQDRSSSGSPKDSTFGHERH